ncbi:MAG: RNA polymerase subunit sigma-70 [Bacteroidetes bacterium HGW-Bacteroidetes-1]|jgi:RNA polymerase sigma-70 factor (ECF subfamily)|nr:MAG: RNA polymerase subunit sigma-70 [Bacteroidetes bacterium HGW-Bacteroidetes-1]
MSGDKFTSIEKKLIEACIMNNRQAQFNLYELFAPRLMPVCRRYAKNNWDAEDIMQEGFIKVFRYLPDFKYSGSFEGWLKRIMVTTAFNFYKRKKITYNETELQQLPEEVVPEMTVTAGLFYQDLMELVDILPRGYHQVFCLNSIEGYTHKEIGDLLNISANTSKSQLTRARCSLQKKYASISDLELKKKSILQSA